MSMSALFSRLAAIGGRPLTGGLLLTLVVASACADKPAVDADLARDLQLATALPPAAPQLNDGPLEAPAPAPVAPRQQSSPRTTVARTPRPVRQPVREHEPREPPRVVPSVESPSEAESQEQAESREPRAESRFRGIRAGANLGLTTRSQVCTSNLPGDKMVATLTHDVIGEDGAVIPAGSNVVLEVASVAPGDTPESAPISLRVRSVVVGGTAHPVNGGVAIASELERGPAAANGSDKKKVIGGAIAGAVIGQVMGRDTRSTVIGAAAGAAAGTAAAAAGRTYHACLPAGSTVRVTTQQPIVL